MTLNGVMAIITLFHRIFMYDVVAKQLLGLRTSVSKSTFNILYDHIKTICAIIQRLFGQNKLVTPFDGRRCTDD